MNTEYIELHNDSEHNYLSWLDSTDEGELANYDICLECDCVRYKGTDNWVTL